ATASSAEGFSCAVPGETVIASFAGLQLAHRRVDDVGAGRLGVELDALDLLATAQNLVGRSDDLLDVLVDGAEVLVEILHAISEALHISDQQSHLRQYLVGGLAHTRVFLDLLHDLN